MTDMVSIPREEMEQLLAELQDLRDKAAAMADPWRARWASYRERVRAREREEGQ